MEALKQLMATLRSEQGCPWDKEQTWNSLVPFTIEEAYEVAEAAEKGDADELKDELGDLLFHITFYSQIAQEKKKFTLDDVILGVIKKMTRRHPHVFGEPSNRLKNAQEVPERWEEIKRREKSEQQNTDPNTPPASVFDDMNSHLPALLWAAKVQRKMGQVGFDWKDADGVMEKVNEEMMELQQARKEQNQNAMEEELGDLLFTLVNLARHMKINPEMALRHATKKFQNRFRFMESRLFESGKSIQETKLEQLESLWQESKFDTPLIT